MGEESQPVGRPSKYTPELLDKCYEYLDVWKEEGDMIPSHVGLALYIDIARDTMYAWGNDKKKPEFSDILDKIMKMQQKELLNNGLSGVFNSTIAKLVLGKHGYSDKQEVESTNKLEVVGDILSKK